MPRHQLGRFELERLIGYGGMGVVFKAHDPELERVLALKLLSCTGAEARAALLREGQLQAQVSHPNVVTIFDVGTIDDAVYLAMEYVAGTDLRTWMSEDAPGLKENGGHSFVRGAEDEARIVRASPAGGANIPWRASLMVLQHAGQGLVAIHDQGLVHADIKPENILVGTDTRVLIADFGIARVLDEAGSEASTSGRGTWVYMAPERLERRGTSARSDQFSFCVTLWECLHGVRPFAGEQPEELLRSMRAVDLQVVNIDMPAELSRVIARGLAIDPRGRYPSMEELLRALAAVPAKIERRKAVGRVLLAGAVFGAMCGLLGYGAARGGAPATEQPESEPAPTMETQKLIGGPEQATDVVRLIDAGLLKNARELWTQRRDQLILRHKPPVELSLAVGVAFMKAAARLEKSDPVAASEAARYVDDVTASVIADGQADPGSVMLAEALQERAQKLQKQLRKAQSKHSTVPSIVE